MAELVVKPKIDLAFKKIFSENENALKSLVSAALDIPVSSMKDLQIGNTEVLPDDLDNKFCRLDLKITVDGRLIDIEIQLNNRGSFQARALYYWSVLFSQSLKSGENYDLLPETVVISIIDFNLFGCSGYHSHFVIKENTRGDLLTDKLSLHFFELKKLPENINGEKQIELWLKLISAETEEEIHRLEKIKSDDIKTALDEVKRLNADKNFRDLIERRYIAMVEEKSALSFAKREGKNEIIEAMRANGISEEEINKIIKFSENKIR